MTLPQTDLKIGSAFSFRKTMTVAEQAMFTGISGNLDPAHVDATRAAALGASGMIAFELAVASLLTTCLARLGGSDRRIGRFELTFGKPVIVGSTVEASAEVVEVEDGRITCTLAVTVDGVGTVMEGRAELIEFADRG